MILALLLLAVQEPPAAPPPPPAPPPALADWSALPELHLRHRADAESLSTFVREEVRAGRCRAPGATLSVEMVVQIAGGGDVVRRVVPRAIDCPTVEQYAAGLIQRMARDNLDDQVTADGWYHSSLTFSLAP